MKRIAVVNVITLIVALVCGAAPASANAPVGVDLARLDGWDVVVAEDAIPSEKYAAEEFQQFFGEASGIKLPIVTAVDRLDRHIFIGPSQAMRSSNVGFSIDDFGDEDLRIIIRDGNIAIAGGRPRGTLYGVYTFLEDYLGVRFLTHDHTHVPRIGDWRVVGPLDGFYHPPIGFRWSAYGEMDNYIFVKDEARADVPRFAARLRCNAVTKDPRLGGVSRARLINHTFYGQVPMGKYGADHPEYYAMIDGKRSDNYSCQPCLTNPEVLKIVIEAVREHLKNNPDAELVSVAQNDGDDWCSCPKCTAINDREESHAGSLLAFVNAVADEIAKTHPDVRVGTLAYGWSQKVPKDLKPRPNVQIQLCSPLINVLRPINDPKDKTNAEFYREFKKWSQISNHMSFWAYDASFPTYSLPVPNIRALEPNIRLFAANNARGVFVQGAHNALGADFSDLRNYMISHLLWDPNLSGQQLMDDFLNLHYGKAAPPIRRYINFLHDNAEAKGMSRHCQGTGEDYKIEEPVIRAGLEAFEEAMKLADNDVVRARVEKASTAAYCSAFAEAAFWTWENRNTTVPVANAGIGWGRIEKNMPPRLARALPYARRYFRLAKKHGLTNWADGVTMEQASIFFKAGFGLKEDDHW